MQLDNYYKNNLIHSSEMHLIPFAMLFHQSNWVIFYYSFFFSIFFLAFQIPYPFLELHMNLF